MRAEFLVLKGSGRCGHIQTQPMPSSQARRALNHKEYGWRERFYPSVMSVKLWNPECYLGDLWGKKESQEFSSHRGPTIL